MEDLKIKMFNMLHDQREDYINELLDNDDLRLKLIELADLKKQVKEIKKQIKDKKKKLVEVMEAANITNMEIADGVRIELRTGSEYFSISYKDIEKKMPHLLKELQPITKTTKRSPTIITRYIGE